jgi:hypothetical protein
MENDKKKLETMEEELKLLKGELKQSLSSVRDFLLNMELPTSEFADVLEALGDSDKQKMDLDGKLTDKPPKVEPKAEAEKAAPEGIREEPLETEPELPVEDLVGGDEKLNPEDELFAEEEPELIDEHGETDEADETLVPEAELPLEEEQPMLQEKIDTQEQSTPKVNLLANLVHWVARAKREIGSEQLPAFLELYGVSGNLSPELKELILHMAEIALETTEDGNSAETWSQAMLSLHGILTGAETPLYDVAPLWNKEGQAKPEEAKPAEEPAEKKQKEMPVKLKLVFPGDDGKGKEFCLELKPTKDSSET